jgi:CO dehydrogenase maturation factor
MKEVNRMAKKIVSTGRGGAGKSTFVALMSRYLKPPSLLIDLDPDLSLADMLGIDFHKEGSPLTPVEDRFKGFMWSDCLYEGKGFDVLTLGTKDLEGCYCYPDHLLRKTISELSKNYMNVVIDSPAGLEHLNRNIVSQVDDLFVVLDPSDKSLIHIKKIKAILKEVGTMYDHFYVLANYMFDEESERYLKETGEIYLGMIEYDKNVEEYNLKGESLRTLPEDSPACRSVKRILEKAGLV